MRSRVVVKFGGADLATWEKIQHAASLVINAPYIEKVVVVSAMGKATDNLLDTINQMGNVSDEDYAEILSMGERTSARVFCSALRILGAKAELFDPADEKWPIITNSSFRNAKPDVEKTKMLVQQWVEPLLSEAIAVIGGFLGKSPTGRVTTLGRGGSDTTALLLARCLDAEEVILVKETSGVLSADPRIVPNPDTLDSLDVHEMFDLAQGGAKIIKPESLKHKLPNQKLRIVNFASQNLAAGGTEITGSFNMNSAETICQRNLLAINVVCEVTAENLQHIFSVLSPKPIYGVSSGRRSLTIFTSDGNVREVLNRLHSSERFKAISHRENVALIQVIHPKFVDSPGGVSTISGILSKNGINIIEVTTSKATINVFIEEPQLRKATEAISHVFET